MNKGLFYIDGALWLANSFVWGMYAHNTPLAVCSFVAALIVFVIAGRIE